MLERAGSGALSVLGRILLGAVIADYLVQMVRRLPPAGAPVVARSTPVVSFGDPARAEVATLGINPSSAEFVDGDLLSGADRRLATLDSLGAERLDAMSDDQIATVVRECGDYFQRRPFRGWFDRLDQILRDGVGVTYYDGSACHLDLIQWATSPIWGDIKDRAVQRALLEDGVPHLRAQLSHENVRLVLLNGRTVVEQVRKVGLVQLGDSGEIPMSRGRCRLFIGVGGGVRWLGWSTNIQSSWGVSREFKQELAAWLREQCAEASDDEELVVMSDLGLDGNGFLPRGTRVHGKTALVDLLRQWLAESQAPTIGEVGTFGGKPWVFVEVGPHEVRLNADTKRAAVETFVRESRDNPEGDWLVIANTRSKRINRVLPGPGPEPLKGWFAYLKDELTRPESI